MSGSVGGWLRWVGVLSVLVGLFGCAVCLLFGWVFVSLFVGGFVGCFGGGLV